MLIGFSFETLTGSAALALSRKNCGDEATKLLRSEISLLRGFA